MTIEHDLSHLDYWRAHPIEFIETFLFDPETGMPFRLLPAERAFLQHAFSFDGGGRLLYTEWLYSCPKKSGKTTFAGIIAIVMVLLYGGGFPEVLCAANSHEQSVSRVFSLIKRIIACSPLLQHEAKVTNDRVVLAGGTITAIASDYSTASGANPNLSILDELWAFDSERDRRLFDELIWPPTKKVAARLTVTYAGFTGESVLLEELFKRGTAQPQVGPDLYAGDGILCFWSHDPVAPWQDAKWLADARRSMRPNQYLRQVENRFVAAETTFINMELFDACVDPNLSRRLSDPALPVWAAVDARVKHDSTALALVAWDQERQRVVLCDHRIVMPTPEQPIDFAATIEQTILDWHGHFSLQSVWFDPFQMAASAQVLQRHGVTMVEYAQTLPALTAMAENLHSLIKGRNLAVYPNEAIRLAVARSVAVEGSRGWKIAKDKQSHKIDVVIALGMAALSAVRAQSEAYDYSGDWISGPVGSVENTDSRAWYAQRLYSMLSRQILTGRGF
jgi:hypothetical protein